MTGERRELVAQVNQIRHHVAHALIGLRALGEQEPVITALEWRTTVRIVHQVCEVIDGWLRRIGPPELDSTAV